MLYAFGFKEIGLVTGDVFFVDPNPTPGQEGAEAGVRLELRRFDRQELRGSIYSAQPISIEEPLWRGDLFESFPDGIGTRNRVHYHSRFTGWDPGTRTFDPQLTEDPLGWLSGRLKDLPAMFDTADHPDAEELADKSDEIVETIDRCWQRVRSGELNPKEGWTSEPAYRLGWL